MEGKFDSLLYKAKFPGVTADTLVYVYSPGIGVNKNHKVEIGEFHGERVHIPQSKFFEFQDYQLLPITPLIQKLYFEMKTVKPLRSIVSSSVGFIANPNLITKEKHSPDQIPVLRGRNVCRYSIENQVYFDFKKQNLAGGTQNKDKLGIRQKILMRKTGFPILSTLDDTGRYPEQSLYFLYQPVEGYSLEYVLGMVNSKLFQYVYWHWMVTNRDATPQLKKTHLDEFPIRTIDFSNLQEKAQLDYIVQLVARILALSKQLPEVKTPHEQESLKRQIEAIDQQIDELVYEFYELSKEEVLLVENSQAKK
jgi:hypothetical protein